jgi:hypothetical protein
VAVIAEMTLRELGRRRAVLLLLVLLPLGFYLGRRDLTGQSVRFLVLGLAWAVSTLALFSTTGARDLDSRLRVCGGRVRDLVVGRGVALLGVGTVLAAGFAVLVAVDQDVRWFPGVLINLGIAVALGVPLGAFLGQVLPRELEGTLTLMVILAVQFLADPGTVVATLLPFWALREISSYAIDDVGAEYLHRGLLHAAVTFVVLGLAVGVAGAFRLRLVRLPAPVPEPSGPR